jgi:hypothetical protein
MPAAEKAPAKKPAAKRKRKSNAGRPTVVTADVVRKLEQAFLMGCTDSEACLFADISPRTLYAYCEKNEEFSQRKEVLKQNPVMQARSVVLDAIEIDRDVQAAQKLLDRKEGSKVALTGADGGPVEVIKRQIIDPGRPVD